MGNVSSFFSLCMTAAILAAAPAVADTVDRIAVTVGNTAITESEILQELRLTAFQNGEPVQTGAAERRAAAERLVDQQLIRKEMEAGAYPQPSDEDVQAVLAGLVQQHGGESQLREAVQKYGLTQEDLKHHVAWQVAVMRFTENRFVANLPTAADVQADPQSANRVRVESEASSVDQQMETWLRDMRAQTRVVFKKGAFE